jgi:AhpC/TSA family
MFRKNESSSNTRRSAPGVATCFGSLRQPSKGLRFAPNLVALALVLAYLGACSRTEAQLKTGNVAPDFSLPGSDGKTYKLSDFRGKQVVVLAWFPKAFTGG